MTPLRRSWVRGSLPHLDMDRVDTVEARACELRVAPPDRDDAPGSDGATLRTGTGFGRVWPCALRPWAPRPVRPMEGREVARSGHSDHRPFVEMGVQRCV